MSDSGAWRDAAAGRHEPGVRDAWTSERTGPKQSTSWAHATTPSRRPRCRHRRSLPHRACSPPPRPPRASARPRRSSTSSSPDTPSPASASAEPSGPPGRRRPTRVQVRPDQAPGVSVQPTSLARADSSASPASSSLKPTTLLIASAAVPRIDSRPPTLCQWLNAATANGRPVNTLSRTPVRPRVQTQSCTLVRPVHASTRRAQRRHGHEPARAAERPRQRRRRRCRRPSTQAVSAGAMFWLWWNRLPGSWSRLTAASRS